jgi:predicted nucleic acid-binding protein
VLVIVDANIIMKDTILRHRKWKSAQDAIAAERLRLILPEVARLEAIGGYRRDHEEKIRQVKSVIRKSTDRAKKAAEALLQVYAEEIDAYEAILDARLLEIGFEIPEPTEHAHLYLTERAVNRRPPFDENGGGYRDTLLWLTALEQVEEAPFSNLLLVSDDGVFTRRSRDLAEELRRETGAELTIARSIANVEFPGEYEDGDFDLSSLDLDTFGIVELITDGLPGKDISRWSPPALDHAEIKHVGRVDLQMETVDVKKRYGSEIYELSIEATADIDAEVLIIHDATGDEVDFSQMSARWDVRVRWRGVIEGYGTGIIDEGIEVLGLDERKKAVR